MALLDLEQLEQQHPRTGRRLSRTLFREQRGVFMVVRAVSAHFGSGSRVRDSATRASGTLGVALARGASSGPNAILSAGHVFPGGVGSTAETPSYLGPFPINSQPIGSVAYHWSPSQLPVPEFDVAVIDLIAPGPIAPLAHAGVAQLPNSLAWPLTGTIHAHGRTLNNVAIMGALTSLTPPAGAPAWRDVWIAGPSGVTRHGDSGAPFVLATTGEVAGCVVGAALGPGSTGAWCDLIQDMRQIEVHCLTPHGYRVT